MVTSLWDQLARRLVDAIGAQRGELIEVRDEAGNQRLLHAILWAIESVGAEPLVQILPPNNVERLLTTVPAAILAERDRRRAEWLCQVERSLTLIGAQPDVQTAPVEARRVFTEVSDRLAAIRAERRIPQVIAAIPTIGKAAQLGISHEELELRMMPALLVEPTDLAIQGERIASMVETATAITITSGADCELRMRRSAQPWLRNFGRLETVSDRPDQSVINVPAGALTTTVDEESVEGTLFLPVAGPARAVRLTFAQGQLIQIEAASGGEQLTDLLNRTSRRMRLIGIGLNPHLCQPLGWSIVDKHIQGAIFTAFTAGNAYHSWLNIDVATTSASLRADDRLIVAEGKLMG